MGSKPQSETTTNSTSTFTPPPAVLAEYKKVTNQANNVAQTPYQSYDDQLVAPISNETNSGINTINEQNGGQNGYNQGAVQQTILGGRAVTPTAYGQANVNQYLSPYINDVVKATEGQIQNQNQQQSSALTGNAISSGAFGGDRSGVAQAALAGQQDIASNQAIASLYNQGFLNAQGEFNNQQAAKIGAQENTAARRLAQGQQLGALGQLQQQEGLQQGAAQVQAGGLQQATQQAADTAAYNQFLQKQAYPFQTTGWLANIAEGIGSQSGGTSTGSSDSTMYGNGLTGLLGGGLGLFSFLNRGGRVGRKRGGVVPRRASGGGGLGAYMDSESPLQTELDASGALGGGSWVVPANLPVGHTMPGSTGAPTTTPSSTTNPLDAQLLSTGASMFKNSSMGDAFSDFTQDTFGFAEGGVVPFRRRRKRFDDGGAVNDTTSAPTGNLDAATAAMSLTPQEQTLYQRHLTNLTGPGGVDNADGSRSTLLQTTIEANGKTYNIPTVYDGRVVSSQEAISRAKSQGLDNFPAYPDEDTAEARYQQMHGYMEKDTGSYLARKRKANGFSTGGVATFRRRFDDGGSVDDALSVGSNFLSDPNTPSGIAPIAPPDSASRRFAYPDELSAANKSTLEHQIYKLFGGSDAQPAPAGIVPIQTTTGETALAAPHAPPTNDNGPYGIVSPLNPPLPPARPTDDIGTPPEARAALAAAMSGGVAPSAASDNSAFGIVPPLNPPLPPVRPGEHDYTDGPALVAGALPDTAKLPPSDPAQHKAMIEADAAEWNEEKAAAAARAAAGNAGTEAAAGVAPATTAGVAPTSVLDQLKAGVARVETGGSAHPYTETGHVTSTGDRAYGKYQVMGANIPSWTKEVTGTAMTPEQFMASPAAQEAVASAKLGQYVASTGSPKDAASLWFTGHKLAQGANLRDVNGMSGATYADRATSGIGGSPAVAAIGSPSGGQGVSQASAPAEHHSQGVLGGLRNLLWGDSGQSGDTMHNPVENAVGNQTSGRSGLLGLNMSDSTRLGLLAAGLGIMGGTSMNPWTNIGQGGLKGLQTAMSAQGLNSEIGLRGAQTANQQAEAIQHMTEAQKSQHMLGNMKKFFEEHDKTQTSNAKAADEGGPPISAPAASPAAPVPTPAPMTGVPAPVAQTGAPLAPAASAAVAPAAATAPAATAPTSSDPWANWRVPPDQDPVRLTQQANTLFAQANRANMAGLDGVARGYIAQAEQLRNKAQTIAGTGDVVYPDGKGGTISGKLPGWVPRQAQVEGSNEAAKTQAALPAEYSKESLKGITDNETAMGENYGPIAQSKQRLQALAGIMQKYQTGHLAEAKADAVSLGRALHIPVPNGVDANPAAFQEFVKNATANVFNQASQLKGRILVTELEGLKAANASPDLQPEANAAILAQGIGLLDAEKAHADDYFKWRAPSKGAAPAPTDVAMFNSGWFKDHNIQSYVDSASKDIGYQGQTIPPAQARTEGQVYVTPKGPMRWQNGRWFPAGGG